MSNSLTLFKHMEKWQLENDQKMTWILGKKKKNSNKEKINKEEEEYPKKLKIENLQINILKTILFKCQVRILVLKCV